MAGPRYTIAQTRARVAALEIAAQHLQDAATHTEIEAKQYADVITKLINEADRLKQKAQERRNHDTYQRESRRRMPEACRNPLTEAPEMDSTTEPTRPRLPQSD